MYDPSSLLAKVQDLLAELIRIWTNSYMYGTIGIIGTSESTLSSSALFHSPLSLCCQCVTVESHCHCHHAGWISVSVGKAKTQPARSLHGHGGGGGSLAGVVVLWAALHLDGSRQAATSSSTTVQCSGRLGSWRLQDKPASTLPSTVMVVVDCKILNWKKKLKAEAKSGSAGDRGSIGRTILQAPTQAWRLILFAG